MTAEVDLTVESWHGDAERVEMLCRKCFKPSIWRVPYYYTVNGETPQCYQFFGCTEDDCDWQQIDQVI